MFFAAPLEFLMEDAACGFDFNRTAVDLGMPPLPVGSEGLYDVYRDQNPGGDCITRYIMVSTQAPEGHEGKGMNLTFNCIDS